MHFAIHKPKTIMGHRIAAWVYSLIDLTGVGLFLHTFIVNSDNIKSALSFIAFTIWSIVSCISKLEDIKRKRIENEEREFDLQVKRDKHAEDIFRRNNPII